MLLIIFNHFHLLLLQKIHLGQAYWSSGHLKITSWVIRISPFCNFFIFLNWFRDRFTRCKASILLIPATASFVKKNVDLNSSQSNWTELISITSFLLSIFLITFHFVFHFCLIYKIYHHQHFICFFLLVHIFVSSYSIFLFFVTCCFFIFSFFDIIRYSFFYFTTKTWRNAWKEKKLDIVRSICIKWVMKSHNKSHQMGYKIT